MGDILNKKKLLGIFDAKKQMNKAVKQEEKERRNVGEGQPLTTTLFNINPSPILLLYYFFPLPFREQWETWTTFYCPKPTIQNPQLFPQLGLNHLIYFYIITIYGFKFYNIGSIWLANLSTRYCKMWTDLVKCNTVIRFWMVMLLQLLLTSVSWKSTLLWFQYLKKKVYNFTSSENKDVTNISPVDRIQTK